MIGKVLPKKKVFKRVSASPRYGAYFSLLEYEKRNRKAEHSLAYWKNLAKPSQVDFNLAQEIAYGVIRRKLTLDYCLSQLVDQKAKIREKILLRMALYQFQYMEKIPVYALVYESVELAKKHISKKSGDFVNAILRKLEKTSLKGPSDKDLEKKYSYPNYLIYLLVQEYGKTVTKQLLEVMNEPAKVMVREKEGINSCLKKQEKRLVYEKKWKVFELLNKEKLTVISQSSEYYIQNPTPVFLVDRLSLRVKNPKKLIDLCASPGGKLLLASELYPNCELYANDPSEKRIQRLKENIEKYRLNVKITQERGEKLSTQEKFDLIILDVPCSNTGVLHKKVEARWNIHKDHIHGLCELQFHLFKHALELLSSEGKIWYLTCSILSAENESFVNRVLKELPVYLDGKIHKVLPNQEGWDGGFGCVFQRRD